MKQNYQIPRIMFAAPHGRSGKTTVTLSVCRALRERGWKVQAYKRGPDYIDPSWLTFASGRSCRNLDTFLMSPSIVKENFLRSSLQSDIAVVEGAMGLYDGVDAEGSGSSAELSKLLRMPVVLIINCQRMTRSAAALINGFKSFDPEVNIAGVILNQVATLRQKKLLTETIKKYCGTEILGFMPKDEKMEIPSRHLGLIPAGEEEVLQNLTEKMLRYAEGNIDLDRIMEIARQAPVLENEALSFPFKRENSLCRIGVIRDRAFSFYYPENLEALEQAGAELAFIDSFQDAHLPPIDGLYIGGGFPELFTEALTANGTLLKEIREQAEKGLPIYAECGGLMYLCLAGVLPAKVAMTGKPQGHGYAVMKVEGENPFFPVGQELKGHEFHYSYLELNGEEPLRYAFSVQRGHGIQGNQEGIIDKNLLATYLHIHAGGTPEWAPALVRACLDGKKN